MSEKSPENASEQKTGRNQFVGGILGLKFTYFFLFGSYGSIWPYLALYFRQNGLNAGYVGVIAGIRPMIQFISCPFWAVIADKYKAPRVILNMSIISWLVMTVLLFIPKPSAVHCPGGMVHNLTAATLYDSPDFHNKTSLVPLEDIGGKKHFISKIKSFILNSPEIVHVSDSDQMRMYTSHSDSKNGTDISKSFVATRSISGSFVHDTSRFNTFLYDHYEVMRVFWALLVLTVVGEFFEAPSVFLLDTSILQCLENINNYGRVRLYGSLGFGVSSFIVGLTLDHVRITICDKLVTNFMVILYFFVAWMTITIILCWITVRFPVPDVVSSHKEDSLISALRVFMIPSYAIFLFVSFYMGFSHGSIMNFINWYLEDLGANRLMMGTATILRDFAVVIGFFVSPTIVENFRIELILFWVFAVYIFSYFSYSLILSPWMAVPVEALQGLAFAIMWASSINHLAKISKPSYVATMQGIIQAVYWGLGTGVGAVVGGICIHHFGSQNSFRYGGYVTLFVAFIFYLAYMIAEKYEKPPEYK